MKRVQLLEILDNVTSALENVLLHQGKHMTPADVTSRQRLVSEARAALESSGREGRGSTGDANEAPLGACILTPENMHTEGDCTLHDHENP